MRVAVAAVAAAAGALLLAGCGGGGAEQPSAAPSPVDTSTGEACNPAGAIAAWPLEQQLRQLLFGGVWTGDEDPVSVAERAAEQGIGGLNFLGNGAEKYADGQLSRVRDASEIPPFLAVDQEGGRVQRLAPIIGDQPSAREMGQTMTPQQVQDLARQTGEAMIGLSLDMDLAPVLGVSDQPNDTVIGDRAFSADPATVTAYAGAYAAGLREAGVIPVLKHFPGLGSASGNTDFEPATTPELSQLEQIDLVPYETLVDEQPVAVMMATAVVPGLTGEEQVGLSPAGVGLLRERYGFDGVVMTDSLSGVAVSSQYSLPEAAELALIAGNDMVLWDSTAEVADVLARLSEAVTAGRLPAEQVVTSVGRVLALKGIDPCAIPTPGS